MAPTQNTIGLNDQQIATKKRLVEASYSFASFKEDWKTLEVGGKKDARSLLGIALSCIALTPGGQKTISDIALGVDVKYVVFASLCALGYFSWSFNDGLFEQFKKRNRAVSGGAWRDFKSSKPFECTENDMLLGYTSDKLEPVRIPDSFLLRHGYILGQSGVGKTVLGKYLMYQQIQRGGGLIFIDGKLDRSSYTELYQFCVLHGRRDDFLIVNPGNPSESNTYNPVLEGAPDEIASRVLTLVPDSGGGADFYRSAVIQAITTIVAALQCLGKAYNFKDIITMLMSDKALLEVERLISEEPYCKDDRAQSFFVWLDQYKSSADTNKDGTPAQKKINSDTLKKNLGGLGGKLFQFAMNEFGEVMNTYDPEVRLFEAITSNKIIYVALPTMGKSEAANSLGQLFIGDLKTSISKLQALPPNQRPGWTGDKNVPAIPAYFGFFDEVGSYATQAMAAIFEQGRSAGIACFPASQTLDNLDAVSDQFRNQIIGNTWTKIFFKLGTHETASDVADLIGMTKRAAKSEGDTSSNSLGARSLQINPQKQAQISVGSSTTLREQEEHLVNPDMMTALGMGECVVCMGDFSGGMRTYHVKVPMTAVSPSGIGKVTDFQINHRVPRNINGINLYERTVKLIQDSRKSGAKEA